MLKKLGSRSVSTQMTRRCRSWTASLAASGVIIADHSPLMANDPHVGTAFSIGYMKTLLERANAEYESSNAYRQR